MEEYIFKFHRVFFNKETGDFDIQVIECQHELHRVKKQIRDGRWQLRKQCKKCCKLIGGAISQHGINLDKELVAIEEPDTWQELIEEKKELLDRLRRKRDEIKGDPFNDYYKTDQWREKRRLVMARDGEVCQACQDAPATEVHHLTYKHFENEPLFDLVAVCKACHTSIHKMEKGENYTPIKHD